MTARFTDRLTGAAVVGHVQPANEQDLFAWTSWHYGAQDEDGQWDWRELFLECESSSGRRECYSALARATLQGLMTLDLKRQRVGRFRGVVVEYLATNPDNRNLNCGLKYVGATLIGIAIKRSMECGMAGRIWLESLKGAQCFYAGLGMLEGTRESKDGHAIYTLEPEQAGEVLEGIRRKQIMEA